MCASVISDYLIIGQGLAGSLLAWQLIRSGKNVQIIDNRQQGSSSRVAGGLFNPVTGLRLHKSDDTEHCLTAARYLYRELENHFGRTFFHEMPILRLFRDHKQQQYFQTRKHDHAYQNYLGTELAATESTAPFINDAGGVIQQQTGYLDIPLLLDTLTDWFQKTGRLTFARIKPEDLNITDQQVSTGNIQAKMCIFCEGYQIQDNPWFDWLPLQPAKGEILTLETKPALPRVLLNKGNWIIPSSGHRCRTGANHDWNFSDDAPSDQGFRQVSNAFEQLFTQVPEYRVIHHQAGIRPATRDKQPFIGIHPDTPSLVVFNGFGAKGSLMIPYYAGCLVNKLVDNTPLPEHASIDRFHS